MDKPTVFIIYFSFLFIVAISTMLRGELEFIRKERAKSARREVRRLEMQKNRAVTQ
jgi:hypothetical protein